MGMNDRERNRKEEARADKARQTVQDGVWRGYVNIPLSAADKDSMAVWYDENPLESVLAYLCGSGVVLSCKFLGAESAFLASATMRDVANCNAGYTVTARSSDALRAIMRVLYTVSLVGVSSDWSVYANTAGSDRW